MGVNILPILFIHVSFFNYRIQHPPVSLPQRVRVRRHRDYRPLQQFRADVTDAAALSRTGLHRQPAYGRRLQEAPVPGVPYALRERVILQKLELGDNATIAGPLDAQRPADGQPARRRPPRSVVRPHHHRIAPVVIEPQPREVYLRRSPRPVVRRDNHAAPPRVHRAAPHNVHANRPHIPSHAIPSILSVHAKTPDSRDRLRPRNRGRLHPLRKAPSRSG